MRISAHLALYMKDKPDGYHGLTAEDWTICKDFGRLTVLLGGLVTATLAFAETVGISVEDATEAMTDLRDRCGEWLKMERETTMLNLGEGNNG